MFGSASIGQHLIGCYGMSMNVQIHRMSRDSRIFCILCRVIVENPAVQLCSCDSQQLSCWRFVFLIFNISLKSWQYIFGTSTTHACEVSEVLLACVCVCVALGIYMVVL